jgi:glutathione S-transferase
MTRIVVSHRVEDEPYGAVAVIDGLAARFGAEDVGYAPADLPEGEEMAQLLRYDVRAARVVVAVIGPRWLDARDPVTGEPRLRRPADWVRAQLAEAFRCGTQVIPVLLRQTPMPVTRQLPADIAVLTWRHALRATPGLPDALDELVRAVGLVLDQPSVPRSRLWPSRPIRDPHERRRGRYR